MRQMPLSFGIFQATCRRAWTFHLFVGSDPTHTIGVPKLMCPQSLTSEAKAGFFNSFTAGLKGLLHPHGIQQLWKRSSCGCLWAFQCPEVSFLYQMKQAWRNFTIPLVFFLDNPLSLPFHAHISSDVNKLTWWHSIAVDRQLSPAFPGRADELRSNLQECAGTATQ